MAVSMKATVRIGKDNTAAVLVKVAGLTDARMQQFAGDVVARAKRNADALHFENSQGDLASKIRRTRLGKKSYRIEAYSDHSSFIEFGTQFIDGKQPFLWPAYRTEKKTFFSGRPWL